MQRTQWDDLPVTVRRAIQERTGAVLKAETAAEGLNSELAALLQTSRGLVFAKGLRSNHPRVWTQDREATVAPYVRPLAPRLLWHIDEDGWNVLGFEHAPGRHADYAPGSPDLPKVIDAMRRLAELPCPPELPIRRAEQRWAEYIDDPADRQMLAGDTLLHTDYNPCNVLVGNRARLIDWAWPTRGAAWIDACCFIVRLMAAGHTAARAEAWAATVPAWRNASREAVDVFTRATVRMWQEIAEADPTAWKTDMASVARTWMHHRHTW